MTSRPRRRRPRPRPPHRPPAHPPPASRAKSRDVRGWAGMSRWDALLSLQEHDTTADQLTHRRAHLPARGELDGLMAELGDVERGAEELQARRHELGRDQQRLEDEIATLTEKAVHHDKTLYSGAIANPRELQSLQDEVAALKRRISQLEDQELEVMEQIEPARCRAGGHRRSPRHARCAGHGAPGADRRGGGGHHRRAGEESPPSGRRSPPPSNRICWLTTSGCARNPGASPSPDWSAGRAAAATSPSLRSRSTGSRSCRPRPPRTARSAAGSWPAELAPCCCGSWRRRSWSSGRCSAARLRTTGWWPWGASCP